MSQPDQVLIALCKATVDAGASDLHLTVGRPPTARRDGTLVPFENIPELEMDEIERIVDLLFDDLRARLADRRLRVEVSEQARRSIASAGFDPVYGARPLRRFIAHEVETRLGRALLAGDIADGGVVRIDGVDGELVVDVVAAPEPVRVGTAA